MKAEIEIGEPGSADPDESEVDGGDEVTRKGMKPDENWSFGESCIDDNHGARRADVSVVENGDIYSIAVPKALRKQEFIDENAAGSMPSVTVENGNTYSAAVPKAFRKEKSLTGALKKDLRLAAHKVAMPNFRKAMPLPDQTAPVGAKPEVEVEEEEDPLLDDSLAYALAQPQPDATTTLRRPMSYQPAARQPTLQSSDVQQRPASHASGLVAPRSPAVRPKTLFLVDEAVPVDLSELKLNNVDAPRLDSKMFDINTGEIIGTIDPEREIQEVGSAYDGWRRQSVEWAKVNLRQVEKRQSMGAGGLVEGGRLALMRLACAPCLAAIDTTRLLPFRFQRE